jgi:hypothetical protein
MLSQIKRKPRGIELVMTITINLPFDTEQKLRQAAAESGVAPDAYAEKLITKGLGADLSSDSQACPRALEEILAPIRKGFQESGMTEDDLDALFEQAITAGARYLVTRDNDLLDLMADNSVGVDFRRRFPDLKILDPAAFLQELSPPPDP